MRPEPPSLHDVLGLPIVLETVVTSEYEDANGHLNVTGYLALHDRAGWLWLQPLGIDPSSPARPRGLMDLEHHLRYLSEVHVGDEVAIHAQLLERSERRVHGILYLVNHSREQLANTLEFVSVHVDLERRRAAPFDADVAAALDDQVAGAKRTWAPPMCGAMGLRPAAQR